MRPRVILIFFTIYVLAFTSLGCEAFRRKFVRKPEKEKEIKVIIETQEYESRYSPEQSYKKYFLFWRISHEELINLLETQNMSRKKRVFAARKIVENLSQMRQLILPEKQTRLDDFISEQRHIVRQVDRYNLNMVQRLRIKNALERQKRQIQREFDYRQIQQYLIKR